MRPTEIALLGLGAKIVWDDPSATTQTACMYCGHPIPAGQARYPYKPQQSFSDWQYLACNSGYLCAACVRFTENTVLTNTAHCVISTNGAWSLSKDANLTWFFETPPKPPFVAVFSDTQKAHLMWKATVTTDVDALRVQFGRERLTIDRPLLSKARGWAQELTDLLVAHGVGRLEGRHHPFVALDRKRADPAHGRLCNDALTGARTTPRAAQLVDHLLSLGEGERWALAVLAKRKPVDPVAEPLAFTMHAMPV